MSCWMQDSEDAVTALDEDLRIVLKHIESQLAQNGFSWAHVVYIHLYIADMNEFATANEVYVRFITQEKCPCGVPSRSTIEMPLLQVGMGKACVEVLVANDQSKNVLHVQSISSWAPSCIGPYSQATLHKDVLYMAVQLGLDPPTMTLCSGGPVAELEQALENSEAVAKSFNCSICSSAVACTIYCSKQIPISDRHMVQEKLDLFIRQMRMLEGGNLHNVLDPIYLYVLVPDLPKRAYVEIKPLLFAANADVTNVTGCIPSSTTMPNSWGFQPSPWHDSCIQKCIVNEKICAIFLSIKNDIVGQICLESPDACENHGDGQNSVNEMKMERVSRFCVYLLYKVVMESGFSWEETTTLRLYLPASLGITVKTVSAMFVSALKELSEMERRIEPEKEPIFNVVPVLGAGKSAESMNDIITCELFAQKS